MFARFRASLRLNPNMSTHLVQALLNLHALEVVKLGLVTLELGEVAELKAGAPRNRRTLLWTHSKALQRQNQQASSSVVRWEVMVYQELYGVVQPGPRARWARCSGPTAKRCGSRTHIETHLWVVRVHVLTGTVCRE